MTLTRKSVTWDTGILSLTDQMSSKTSKVQSNRHSVTTVTSTEYCTVKTINNNILLPYDTALVSLSICESIATQLQLNDGQSVRVTNG